MWRISLKVTLCALVSVFACGFSAIAQRFPERAMRIVVPFPPGGTADVVSRILAQRLAVSLGQQVIVDNRGGASGIIASEIVARATPDGHTLLLAHTGTHAVNPTFFARLPYDAVKDFSPISLIATGPHILVVNPAVRATSVKELIDLAKARPGALNCGSGGSGTVPHLAAVLFAKMANIDIVHVQFKGAALAVTDLMSGGVQLSIVGIPPALPQIKAGRLLALGVTSLKSVSAVHGVPPVADTLPRYEAVSWYGVVTPRGTPGSVVARLHAEISKILLSAEIIDSYSVQGQEAASSTPEELARLIKTDMAKWGKTVKDSGAMVN